MAANHIVDRIALPGGRQLVVRDESPADFEGVISLYDRLAEQERYCRFFSGNRPPDASIERKTHVCERGGVGFVAVLTDGTGQPRTVAEASYELLPSGDGELGIAIESRYRGWLGPYLFHLLIDRARTHGVPNIQAEVLVDNRPMLALLRSRRFVTLSVDYNPATIRVAVGTSGTTPTWSGGHEVPRVLVETPSGIWQRAKALQAQGLHVVTCPTRRPDGPPCPVTAGQVCPLAEDADVIAVVALPSDGSSAALIEAHRRLHRGVPLCTIVSPSEPTRPDVAAASWSIDDDELAAFLRHLASSKTGPSALEGTSGGALRSPNNRHRSEGDLSGAANHP